MSLSDWHHQVSQRYADLHHGKVAEMRKNKATTSIPFDSQPQRLKYWEMEQWLIEHGESVQAERKKPKPVSGESQRTLHNWYHNRRYVFDAVCRAVANKEEK